MRTKTPPDIKVRSTSGSTIELTNTTTSLGDNAFVGGLAFRNDDTSGTEPHYAGIKARTDGAGGSQMELEFNEKRNYCLEYLQTLAYNAESADFIQRLYNHIS